VLSSLAELFYAMAWGVFIVQDGDVAKLGVLLSKRAEVLFSIDAKDSQTGGTAVISASRRGHQQVTIALSVAACWLTRWRSG